MTMVLFAMFVGNTLMMYGWQSGINLSRNKTGERGGLRRQKQGMKVHNHFFFFQGATPSSELDARGVAFH